MEFLDFLNKIQTEFPQAIPILSQPGVLAVYKQAIDEGWAADRINAALEQTEWWKTTDQSARQWQALQITDPASASQRATDTKQLLQDAMAATGVQLSNDGGLGSQQFQFFAKAVQQGWDAARIRYELLAIGGGHGGDVAAQATTVKGLANDYGVPLSDAATMDWATKLAQGAITTDSVRGYLVEQAKSLFPALAGALDRGITVRQYVDPYLQIAQQELGINPATVSLTDQKWMTALNQVDPKTGQRVSMSLDDWLKKIRTDPAYGYDTTSKGRQDATQLATTLQAKFGAAA